jgi:hypothetical protein
MLPVVVELLELAWHACIPPFPVRGVFAKDVPRGGRDERGVLRARALTSGRVQDMLDATYKVKGGYLPPLGLSIVLRRGLVVPYKETVVNHAPSKPLWFLLRSWREEIGYGLFWPYSASEGDIVETELTVRCGFDLLPAVLQWWRRNRAVVLVCGRLSLHHDVKISVRMARPSCNTRWRSNTLVHLPVLESLVTCKRWTGVYLLHRCFQWNRELSGVRSLSDRDRVDRVKHA